MRIYINIFLVLFANVSLAQYTGGDADGFSWLSYTPTTNKYYTGGDADGFSILTYTPTVNNYYSGGDADGFGELTFTPLANKYYTGGDSDGFSFDKVDGNNYVYEGGDADGFALQNVYQEYIWTGTIGTGWNVTGNWSTNQIPSLRHDVTIPAGAAHWPAVNAGVLSIGRNPNNAQYICNSILVDTGAQMTTRINCFVTNYGAFFVKGNLYVKNTAVDAFVNKINSHFGVQNGTAIFGN